MLHYCHKYQILQYALSDTTLQEAAVEKLMPETAQEIQDAKFRVLLKTGTNSIFLAHIMPKFEAC